MFRLIPREESFFDLFEAIARNVHQGAVELVAFLDRYDDRDERAKRIKDIEHAGDQYTRDTLRRLNQTFITPLDREDIHELVARMDDVIDLIDSAVTRLTLYKIEKPTDDAIAIARGLKHATAVLVEAMTLLRDLRNAQELLAKCVAVHTQESEGDRLEQHGLALLFESRKDPVDIIKWKDVYEDLEAATDRCEDVANVIEAIVLKNA